jgi:hypothetical protein
MPYLNADDRAWIDTDQLDAIDGLSTPGELNYLITAAVIRYLGKFPKYERLNAAIGALECAKLELYRRVVSPYEYSKIEDNGDVYPKHMTERNP